MRRPMSWLVVWSSAALLLTAMKLPGGSGNPPKTAGEPRLTYAYLPRENSTPAVIPALLTTRGSAMPGAGSAPLLQFELLANRVR